MMHHIFYGCLAAMLGLYFAGFGWLAVQGPAIFLLVVGGINGWAHAEHVAGWTPMATVFGIALVLCLPRLAADAKGLIDD